MNYETSINKQPISAEIALGMSDDDAVGGPTNSSRRLWAILLLVAILIGAAAAYYYTHAGADGKTAAAADDDKKTQSQTVTVIAPGSDTVVRSINASGTLAARFDIPVGVVGEGGQVSRVFVDAGDWVRQGQTLISIDRSVQAQQAAALGAQIEVSRADLQLAEGDLGRALQLVDRGFISKADVDRKIATRNAARARVNVAQAQLNEARARDARLNVRAPVSGYVIERMVMPGQTVSASSGTLFRIAQGGEMELRAQLSEGDLAAVSQGVSASVTPVGAEREFTGRIWQISPVIDAQSRQGIARIALPFDRALRPGGFANVVIKAGATTAPILPESAVQNDKDGSYVYIIDQENKATRRGIKLGDVTPGGIVVTEGLNGTERIVLRAAGFLSPGEVVIPQMQKKQ
jgi:HlyD family secretion protein